MVVVFELKALEDLDNNEVSEDVDVLAEESVFDLSTADTWGTVAVKEEWEE